MRSIISFIALLLPGVAISGGHLFSLRPFVSYVDYPEAFSMKPSAAYGGALELHAGPRSTFSLNISSASSSAPADVVGGTQSVPISLTRVHAGFQYRLVEATPWLGLGAGLSGGVARFSTPDQTISLGALGTQTFEGMSDTRVSISASAVADLRLGDIVSFVIEPGAAVVTPVSADHVSYFVSGGIRIGLF
jgi:hypothetical protein